MPGRRSLIALAGIVASASMLGACASTPAVPGPAIESLTTVGPITPETAAVTAVTTTVALFTGTSSPVTAADLPTSWRSGCPVGPEDLRLLRLAFWGFDGQPHQGALVVHATVATAVVEVFRRLHDQRFPIRRMEPVDVYGGSDDASTAADNTAGFNCRNAVASGPPHWSAHAYGRAVDVNPVENPYVLDGVVLPPAGAPYADRSQVRPGMAVANGVLTNAFRAVGWSWGGIWGAPDYQHFSETGN